MTYRVSRMMLGGVFCAASTTALAQTGQPIAFKYGEVPGRFSVTGDLVCRSSAHAMVLRGVAVTDSAAAKKLFVSQTAEIWKSAGQDLARIRWEETDAVIAKRAVDQKLLEAKAANRQQFVDLYNKFLPEFRALVPAAQQAKFDQNLQALQDSGYTNNKVVIPVVCYPTEYQSLVYGFVLRGITFGDSAAIKKLVYSQAEEIWRTASKDALRIENKGTKATEAGRAANRALHQELYDKLLPALRPLVPAAQQATFDQNLKALQESHYTFVVEGVPPGMSNGPDGRSLTTVPLSAAIGCGPTKENCFPEETPFTVPVP